jgi:hypothetical protein
LGGANQLPRYQNNPILSKTKIFVGMDVTHLSPGSQNGALSIAAVVVTEGSTNFIHWPVSLRLQPPEEDKKSRELIDDWQAMLKKHLGRYKEKTKGNCQTNSSSTGRRI